MQHSNRISRFGDAERVTLILVEHLQQEKQGSHPVSLRYLAPADRRVGNPPYSRVLQTLHRPHLVSHPMVEVAEEGAGQHADRAVAHRLAVVLLRAARVGRARSAERGAVLVAGRQVHGVQLLVDDAQLQALRVAADGREEHAHLQHWEDEDEAESAARTNSNTLQGERNERMRNAHN